MKKAHRASTIFPAKHRHCARLVISGYDPCRQTVRGQSAQRSRLSNSDTRVSSRLPSELLIFCSASGPLLVRADPFICLFPSSHLCGGGRGRRRMYDTWLDLIGNRRKWFNSLRFSSANGQEFRRKLRYTVLYMLSLDSVRKTISSVFWTSFTISCQLAGCNMPELFAERQESKVILRWTKQKFFLLKHFRFFCDLFLSPFLLANSVVHRRFCDLGDEMDLREEAKFLSN